MPASVGLGFLEDVNYHYDCWFVGLLYTNQAFSLPASLHCFCSFGNATPSVSSADDASHCSHVLGASAACDELVHMGKAVSLSGAPHLFRSSYEPIEYAMFSMKTAHSSKSPPLTP
jgi:hypothetical protein